MNGHVWTVIRNIGLLLHVPAIMAVVTLPVCLVFDEAFGLLPFALTALAAVIPAQLLFRLLKGSPDATLLDAMVVTATAWAIIPLFGAMPFLLVAANIPVDHPAATGTLHDLGRVWNACFEAFSGYTGTGLTVAVHPSELPKCLQWWRSFMEWVGGVGVVVVMLSVLRPSEAAYRLYASEGREDKILPSVTATVRTLWWIYIGFTVIAILTLAMSGVAWWESINHGMTAIATGGFSITDDSMVSYPASTKILALLFIILGAMSFAGHYRILRKGEITSLWRDPQHRLFGILLVVGGAVVILENSWFLGDGQALDSVFQWVSALATAGFQTVGIDSWSPTAKLLLAMGMVIGGEAGATVGGIKIARFGLLLKGLVWRLRRIRRTPHQMMRYVVNGEAMSEEKANRLLQAAAVLILLWIVTMVTAVFVVLHVLPPATNLADVVFEIASAQGNVGLTVGICGPQLHWVAKLTMMAAMWMGRLEIVPVLVLFFVPLFSVRVSRAGRC